MKHRLNHWEPETEIDFSKIIGPWQSVALDAAALLLCALGAVALYILL